MKAVTFSSLFVGLASAHYAIKELTIDGNKLGACYDETVLNISANFVIDILLVMPE
jgi:hypothetical protein